MAILPILVAVVLILPGVIAYCAYVDTIWGKPLTLNHFSRDASVALVAAVILNTAWVMLGTAAAHLFNIVARDSWQFSVDYHSGMKLLAGVSNDISPIINHPMKVLVYFLSMYATAWMIGVEAANLRVRAGHSLLSPARKRYLPKKAGWAWLFRQSEFGGLPVDMIMVSALVEIANERFRYVGQLVDYWPDANGNLDAILLHGVTKIDLKDGTWNELEAPFLVICHIDLRAIGIRPFNTEFERTQSLEEEIVRLNEAVAALAEQIDSGKKDGD